jgi:hypothetical protein
MLKEASRLLSIGRVQIMGGSRNYEINQKIKIYRCIYDDLIVQI